MQRVAMFDTLCIYAFFDAHQCSSWQRKLRCYVTFVGQNIENIDTFATFAKNTWQTKDSIN